MKTPTFIAIDFETADHGRDSACAVGIVKVRGARIVHEETRLIRPPRRTFCFSYLHHITWEDVADKPAFRQVWRTLRPLFEDVDFLAAHNAPFDRAVLHTCCETARIRPPHQDFVCTVRLARRVWGIYPTSLPHVCLNLALPLNHHDPLSDARACAKIVIEAMQQGWSPDSGD
jgi:DNA polymerase-3 subunit epsilon